jgi:hypothetical protein
MAETPFPAAFKAGTIAPFLRKASSIAVRDQHTYP